MLRYGRGPVLGLALAIAGLSGCASLPPLDNPLLVKPGNGDRDRLGSVVESGPTPDGYAEVYERALDALDDYFVVVPSSRHSGTIETLPRVAPGYEQPWKPGSPKVSERLRATLQTIRHTAIVRIEPAERGFKVAVEVYKQQEVTPVAGQSAGGRGPIFRDVPTGERKADIVDSPANPEGQWVAAGAAPHRDFAFEQAILRKIQFPAGMK